MSAAAKPAVASTEIRRIAQIAATAAAAMIALGASRLPSQAQASHMLVVPASDGYGFDDCLAGNKACGQTIADAWCAAHGMTVASSFGRADDITASIALVRKPTSVTVDPGSFIVNCKD